MAVSAVSFLPLSLIIAPISMIVLMIALKKKKVWLTRLCLFGMGLAVLLLVIFQYMDYKHFEDCLLQGAGYYKPFRGACITFN